MGVAERHQFLEPFIEEGLEMIELLIANFPLLTNLTKFFSLLGDLNRMVPGVLEQDQIVGSLSVRGWRVRPNSTAPIS